MKMTGKEAWMPYFLVVYCAASFLHFSHNAIFLESYPNMPAWLSPLSVWTAWCAVTAIGVTGYLLMRAGYRWSGLALLALYGALGLDSLSHYSLAPFSAHSFTMNLTILLDAATALVVLTAVATIATRRSFKRE
jgi:hypothetical protein